MGFLGAPWGSAFLGGTGVASLHLHVHSTRLRRCTYPWTRPSGGILWGHYLRSLLGVHWALEAEIDFPAIEHRLIPARVRSEWSRLRTKWLASVWSPASQDSSHVGNAGVGVISMRGALVASPSFATAAFRRFFDCGRAV